LVANPNQQSPKFKLQCSGEELRYLVFHACSADWISIGRHK